MTTLTGPAVMLPDDEISFLELWRILCQRKKLVLTALLLGIALSAIAGLLMTPVYRAEVLLAPVTADEDRNRLIGPLGELGGFAALAGVNLQRGGRKNEAIAVLESRVLTEQFIKDEKLLPVLFRDRWAGDHANPEAVAGEKAPTLSEAYELFDEDIRRVFEDKKTGLVVLAVEWTDPLLAAQWANELVRRVNAVLRQRSTEESQKAIHFLQEQIKQTSAVELQQVLHQLVEAEMKEIILANVREEFAFRVIDPAIAPDKPFKPLLRVMLLLGAMLGLFGGVILALFKNFLESHASNAPPS